MSIAIKISSQSNSKEKRCMTFSRVLDNLWVRNPRSSTMGFTLQPSLQAVKTGHFRLLYLDGEIHQITSSSSLQPTISTGNSRVCPELDIRTVWVILEQHAWKSPAEVPYWIRCCLTLKQEFIWFSLKEEKIIKAEEVVVTWGQCHRWQGLPTSLPETGNLSPKPWRKVIPKQISNGHNWIFPSLRMSCQQCFVLSSTTNVPRVLL